MHGTGIKIIEDQQAKLYNIYKNAKLKLINLIYLFRMTPLNKQQLRPFTALTN